MKKDKLLALAALLRQKHAEWSKLPEGIYTHFNLNFWKTNIDESCGFAGCAIGTLIEFSPGTTNLYLERFTRGMYHLRIRSDDNLDGFDAVAKEFDLSLDDAYYLFDSKEYAVNDRKNPLSVAERIENLVAKG